MASVKIPKRKLGNTNLELSVIGFGASPLGGVFGDVTDESASKAVHDAFNAGINFFDTSPFYGATKSETVLGKCLQGLPREEVVIATKVGRYGDSEFDFSAERVTASVKESLARLQTPYIDLIQCHDMEFAPLDDVINGALPALWKLKQEGLVKHVGITGLPLKIFDHVLDRVPPGSVDSVLSYCHCNLFDSSLLDAIPSWQAKGVGVINASPLSMGLLTNRGPPVWHPAPQDIKDKCKAAAELAASKGVDIAKIGLKWALRQPGICSTLVGMASSDLVDLNVQAALEALNLVESPTAELEEQVTQEVLQLLAPIKNKTWPSGLPENN